MSHSNIALENPGRRCFRKAVRWQLGSHLFLCLAALATSVTHAAQTINYTDGQTDSTNYSTSGANNPTTLSLTAGSAIQSGILSGTGAVIKAGDGYITLTAANTYTGTTTVSNGVLKIQNATALGTTAGGTTVSNGASLELVGGITVTGEALTLNGQGFDDGALRSSSGNNEWTSLVTLGSNSRINASTGSTLTLSGGVTATNRNLRLGGSGNTVLNGLSLGTGSLTKGGAGTATLTGTVSYSGGTTISSGTLQIGNGGTTGSISGNITNNSALIFNRSDNLNYTGNITGSGTLEKLGAGRLTLTGANDFSGGTTITAGSLRIGNGGTTGSLTGDILNNAALIFNRSDTLTYSGAISGTGMLTKEGAGDLLLTGLNTHSGKTLISEGRVDANANFTLSEFSELEIASGATVRILSTEQTLAALSGAGQLRVSFAGAILNVGANDSDSTFSGTLTGNDEGLINKIGTGTLSLTGASSYGGKITVESGGLLIGDDSALGTGDLTLEDGTLFGTVLGDNAAIANNVVIHGDIEIQSDLFLGIDGTTDLGSDIRTLTFTQDDGFICFEGAILGDATAGLNLVAGTGVDSHMVMMCSITGNTYGGLTTVGDGISLDLAGLGTLINGDLLIKTEGKVLVDSDDALGSTGSVTVDGVLDLLGAENQTINELRGSGQILGGSMGTTLTVNAGEFAGKLDDDSGSLNLIKASGGTLTLTGANTYTGGTILNAGTLQTQNAAALGNGGLVINGGTLAPTGTLNLTNLTWTDGKITLTIGSTPNFVAVSGNLTLTAPGKFTFLEGLNFQTNKPYLVLEADNLDSFSSANFSGSLLYGLKPKFTVLNDQLFVSFTGTPTASGPLLQNTAGTPTFANFIVNGPVTTGAPNESNTIEALTFLSGSSLRIFNNLTVTSGNFDVGPGNSTVFGGTVLTPGDFNKNGNGTLYAWSDFRVGGVANLNGGSLYVNGRFTAANGFNVAPNTRLGGSGVLIANLTNNGTLAPGNSPGTLTVNGNFTQTTNGTLEIEIANLSVFDRLIVSGNAALAGTLQVIPFGGNELEYGQQFNFLSAGSISGQFDTVTMPENFRGRILVEGGEVTLVAAPSSYTLVAETQNQQNVAAALNAYIPATTGDRLTVSIALDQLTAAQYPAAFDQISPAFYQTLTSTVIEQYNAQGQFLQQRFSSVALGRQAGFAQYGFSAPAFTEKTLDPKNAKAKAGLPTRAESEESVSKNWGLWIQGNGIFSRNTSVQNLPRYRSEGGGFLVGGDYRWSDTFVTGVFGGYQGAVSRYGNGGRSAINAVRFGTYATYDAGNGFYANTVVGGGYSAYDVKRPIQFGNVNRNANSSPGGAEFTSQFATGYDWKVGGLTIGPIASVQYTYAGIGGFTENGADSLNLAVGQQNANSLRSSLGARAAYLIPISKNFALIPELRLSWQHEFLMNPTGINAGLDGGNGPGFGYTTSAPSRDAVFAGAGVTLQLGERWNANVYYNSSFGRQDFTSQMISTSLGFNF